MAVAVEALSACARTAHACCRATQDGPRTPADGSASPPDTHWPAPTARALPGCPNPVHMQVHMLTLDAPTCTPFCTLPCRTRAHASSSSSSTTAAAKAVATAAAAAAATITSNLAICNGLQWQHSTIPTQQPWHRHQVRIVHLVIDRSSGRITVASISSVGRSRQPRRP